MMWNWKLMYEDDDFALYCDIDNVAGAEEDEQGLFPSAECYRSLPEKIAVWVSIALKKDETIKAYAARRKGAGLPAAKYKHYAHTLGLVELDAVNGLYRTIPAIDFDEKDNQLGTSSLLSGEDVPLVKGIEGDWSKINARKTSKAIKAIFRFFYPPASAKN